MARKLRWSPSRVEEVTFESRALEGNPLGDPHKRKISVYLPPGYDLAANGRKQYPVVYVLSGFTGFGKMQLNAKGWGESLDMRLDRLIEARKVRPMIVVLPDCFTRLGGSQYIDSSANGRYETHLIKELIPFVDRTYRTLASGRHRGVVGKSSGGYGALVQGMKHPGVFGAVACHSGDAAFEYCYLPDFPHFLNVVREYGSVRKFVKAFEEAPKKTNRLIQAMNILAMASCYSPNPKRNTTLGIDFPFDFETGAMRPAIWRKWLRHDPLRMVPGHAAKLRKLRVLFIDVGTKDEFNLQWGARMISAELKKHRVRHVYQEFNDGHMDISYRYDVSFPLLSKNLG